MNRRILAVLLFTLISSSVLADEPEPSIREEIVVTASRAEETTTSTTASVTVIDREDLAASKARDVAEALREVPGVIISRSGSQGKATSLFMRGGNSTGALVLWNGIEINNPYFAGYDWGRFSTAGVEQIEVVRGPFSALYGADAAAGVINILTTPRSSRTELRLETGEEGLLNGSIDGGYVGSNFVAHGSFEHRDDDGFFANDDFSQDSALAGLNWTAGAFTAGVQARYTSYELGIPFNVDLAGSAFVPSPDRRQEGSELQVSVPLTYDFGRGSVSLTLAESSRDDDFADPDDPFGFVSSSTESTARRAQANVRVATLFGTVIAGGEVERAEVDDVSTYGIALDGSERESTSFFVEDRYSRELGGSRFEVSAGVRYDDFDTFGSEWSPRVGVAWLKGAHKVRASFGQGFRAPSIGELYFPFSGNALLDPEKSRSSELGYEWLASRGAIGVTLFRNSYDNLIVFDNASFLFQNTGAALTQGIEVAARSRWRSRLQAAASYTYLDTEQEDSRSALLRRPRHSGSLDLTYTAGATAANVVLVYAGRRADVLPVFPYSRASNGAYTTLDANLQRKFGAFTPYVKVENLTDETYEEVLGYRAPGRRALIGVRYSLQ